MYNFIFQNLNYLIFNKVANNVLFYVINPNFSVELYRSPLKLRWNSCLQAYSRTLCEAIISVRYFFVRSIGLPCLLRLRQGHRPNSWAKSESERLI